MNCKEAQNIILHSDPKELHRSKEGKAKGIEAMKHILRCINCLMFLSKHTDELYAMQKASKESQTI